LLAFACIKKYNAIIIMGDKNMDKHNKEALLNEVWEIVLEASGGEEIDLDLQIKLDTLEDMLDNALGLNEKGIKRSINYGLSVTQKTG
jgi:hypothetical protein